MMQIFLDALGNNAGLARIAYRLTRSECAIQIANSLNCPTIRV
jgi:hypothetical protein